MANPETVISTIITITIVRFSNILSFLSEIKIKEKKIVQAS